MRLRAAAIALVVVASLFGAPGVANAAPTVEIIKVYYDSPGKDTGSNPSLNAEYVVLKNNTGARKSITGWTIRDAANHVYKFGSFSLAPGKTVTIHTGRGTNTSTHRYWGLRWYVWNNTGDRAILKSAGGTTIDTCSFTSSADYKNC